MKFEVTYTNPNNVTDKTYKFETDKKVELNRFLKKCREYSGSYRILEIKENKKSK